MYLLRIFCKSWTREREWIKCIHRKKRGGRCVQCQCHNRERIGGYKSSVRSQKKSHVARSAGSWKGSEFRSQNELRTRISVVSSNRLHTKENVEASPHTIVIVIVIIVHSSTYFLLKCVDQQSVTIYHSQKSITKLSQKSNYNIPVLIVVY